MKRLIVTFAVFVIAGAFLWNGWVFGFLNHGVAGYLHMSISELEVRGQPYKRLFDILEDISGVCMIIGGLGLIALAKHKKNSIMPLILALVVAIGSLTLYDVAHPLDCNRYDNPACVARINTDEVSHTNVLHNDESFLTAYITTVLGLIIVCWTILKKLPRYKIVAFILLAAGIIITLYILDSNGNVELDAISERIWNVLVSIDIGYIGWQFIKLRPSSKIT